MTAALIVVGILVVLALGYRIRCAVDPFTTRGRRRAYDWGRSWWRGEQAQNRDIDWT